MASTQDIAIVKVNTLETKYPAFTDEDIGAMLDAHNGSVSYVSYKIAMLKSDNQAVSLGPISFENNSGFWNSMAALFLREYEQEKKDSAENYGGTIYMKRADEMW